MDNTKVFVGNREGFGRAVYALENISQGEVIAAFDGAIYVAERCTDLPKDIADHAIQIDAHFWQESSGIARYLNHSCEPNCGIQNFNQIVTMCDIKKGEELTWDYDMTEDSDWRMECLCGTSSCRHVIGAYGQVPENIRRKYGKYISGWLRKNKDNPKVGLGHREGFGSMLFALENIAKNECLATFGGTIYEAERATKLPPIAINHAIQIDETHYRDSDGFARDINHSCEPNCGLHDSINLVARRDIKEGEELTWDYEMSEDSDWVMECKCGEPTCRKFIGAYRNSPQSKKDEYREYTSEWLKRKYLPGPNPFQNQKS
jgi:hypothetical protein